MLLLRLELYIVVLCNSGVAVGVLTNICFISLFFFVDPRTPWRIVGE